MWEKIRSGMNRFERVNEMDIKKDREGANKMGE